MNDNKHCDSCKFWELLPWGENQGYCAYNGKPSCVNHSQHEEKKP